MIKSYQNKKALLVGNGVNRVDPRQSYSWEELLQELKKTFTIDVDLDNIFKPFPLAFDEMLHNGSAKTDFNEKIKELKQQIRLKIEGQLNGKKGFNDYHRKLVNLGYDDILTTNYDYSLQLGSVEKFFEKKSSLAMNKQEQKYSLKRCYAIPDRKLNIWHIHGELFDSRSYKKESKNYQEESMMIGYAHYASYLNAIQQNIKGKSGNQEVENQSLMVRLKNKVASPFWTDIFFTHDVDIIGQGLDFSENHLWWLINYRANAMRQSKPKHKIKINNSINFFHPEITEPNHNAENNLEKKLARKNSADKSKAIAELLKAFNVESKPVRCKSHEDFYKKITSGLLPSGK